MKMVGGAVINDFWIVSMVDVADPFSMDPYGHHLFPKFAMCFRNIFLKFHLAKRRQGAQRSLHKFEQKLETSFTACSLQCTQAVSKV